MLRCVYISTEKSIYSIIIKHQWFQINYEYQCQIIRVDFIDQSWLFINQIYQERRGAGHIEFFSYRFTFQWSQQPGLSLGQSQDSGASAGTPNGCQGPERMVVLPCLPSSLGRNGTGKKGSRTPTSIRDVSIAGSSFICSATMLAPLFRL